MPQELLQSECSSWQEILGCWAEWCRGGCACCTFLSPESRGAACWPLTPLQLQAQFSSLTSVGESVFSERSDEKQPLRSIKHQSSEGTLCQQGSAGDGSQRGFSPFTPGLRGWRGAHKAFEFCKTCEWHDAAMADICKHANERLQSL